MIITARVMNPAIPTRRVRMETTLERFPRARARSMFPNRYHLSEEKDKYTANDPVMKLQNMNDSSAIVM